MLANPDRGRRSHYNLFLGSASTIVKDPRRRTDVARCSVYSAFRIQQRFGVDVDSRPVVTFPHFPEAHTDGEDLQMEIEEAID